MPKQLKINDLRNRVEWALGQIGSNDRVAGPVDLDALAERLGIKVEWRHMIPEGVTVADAERVTIYLQSNFRNGVSSRRERFTFAHELCHALFYENISRSPKALPGTPCGAALEKLCQRGAGYLLVPGTVLSTVTKRNGRVCAVKDVEALSKLFEVSIDVIVRRLHEEDTAIDNEYGIFVLRKRGETYIDAGAFGIALRALRLMPTAGQLFTDWLHENARDPGQVGPGSWTKRLGDRELAITRLRRSASTELLELKSEPANTLARVDQQGPSLF